MVKKERSPLRLTRAEEEMILAIRECRRRRFAWSRYRTLINTPGHMAYLVNGHPGMTLPAALKKAKGARR